VKGKVLPDAMKPRKMGLIKDIKLDETRSPIAISSTAAETSINQRYKANIF
jgi:hypothetical protein